MTTDMLKKPYLTEIQFSLTEARKFSNFSVYSWHQQLWSAFSKEPGEKSPFLFRTIADHGRLLKILLLSEVAPKTLEFGVWKTTLLTTNFFSTKKFQFEVLANPVKQQSPREDGPGTKRIGNPKKVPLTTEEQQFSWLERKFRLGGSRLQAAEILESNKLVFKHRKRLATINSVKFRGILEVTDTNLFLDLLASGIGPSKAFGFGLLMLKPIYA